MHRLLLVPAITLAILSLPGCAFNDDAEIRLLQYTAEVNGEVDGVPVGGNGAVQGCRVDAAPELLARMQATLSSQGCIVNVRPDGPVQVEIIPPQKPPGKTL